MFLSMTYMLSNSCISQVVHLITVYILFNFFLWNKVKKDDATYSETPVEISGSDDAVKKAKELIEKIINPESSLTNNMRGNGTASLYVILIET